MAGRSGRSTRPSARPGPRELAAKPKYYVLDMFPYPSGRRACTSATPRATPPPTSSPATSACAASTCCTRWAGTPSACRPSSTPIKTGTHPRDDHRSATSTTSGASSRRLGFSYDWDREINTTDPDYYRWTQWIFRKLYERGLAYEAEVPVNWCPALGTVLANEEVIDGKSERGGHPVDAHARCGSGCCKITAYADRLLDDLDELDWPEYDQGDAARLDRPLARAPRSTSPSTGRDATLRVFTTRPDTLFGATYMVLAPEHPLVDAHHHRRAARRGARPTSTTAAAQERPRSAPTWRRRRPASSPAPTPINPVNGEQIPIWIADYVLMSYGTGAIMAVPGHDERDCEFAENFDLPIVRTVAAARRLRRQGLHRRRARRSTPASSTAWTVAEAKAKMIAWLEEKGLGERKVNYKLRDWLFSRQRYWGEPFPLLHAGGRRRSRVLGTDELPRAAARARRLQAVRRRASRRWPRVDGLGRRRPTRSPAQPAHARDQHHAAVGRLAAGTTCASSTRTTTRRAWSTEAETLLDAGRPLRRRRRARGAAPALRALLAQGALRPAASSRTDGAVPDACSTRA